MKISGQGPVPLLMRLAAHPLRWALLTELAASDLRVRELTAAVGEPQNLVSYHLGLLRRAGLVTARRSSFDGRDTYYHLNLAHCASAFMAAAAALHPALARVEAAWQEGRSVLFLCTGNSARSPIAEALLRSHHGNRVRVASAGSHPRAALHPNTVRVLREEYGLDLAHRRPQSLAEVSESFDYVITLCDKIREIPRDHGSAVSMHWSLPDPAASAASNAASYPAFQRVTRELESRITFLSLSSAQGALP